MNLLDEDVRPHTVSVMIYNLAMGVPYNVQTYVDPVGVSVGPFTIDEQKVLVSVSSKSIPSDENLYLIDINGREAPRLLTKHLDSNACQYVVGSAR